MLIIGDVFDERYKIIKKIGQGGMGAVFLAVDSLDGSNWAIKEEKITEQNRKLLFSEAEIMEKVTYPAFPRLRYKKEVNGYLYLVMEYIDGHTLEDEISSKKKISESQAVEWFKQICNALIYLHGLDSPIVYRDFKPSNLMVEKTGKIRIIDLGIAQQYQGDGAKVDMAVLTRGYAAPEQYNKRYKSPKKSKEKSRKRTKSKLLSQQKTAPRNKHKAKRRAKARKKVLPPDKWQPFWHKKQKQYK